MSRLKKEILGKLKEYGSKMGTNTMGGDDYTSKKKGGLRDFDGYDNVQYNKDMPMDEMQVVNKKTGKDITKHLLDYMEGKIDKKKFEKLTGLKKESVKEAQQVNLKSVDVLRRAVQKINKKYKVQVSKIGPTKGEVEIELGSGNHPDRDYRAIDNLVKKIGIKRYSVFNEGNVNEVKFNKKKVLSTLAKVLRTPRIEADSIQQFIDVYFTNLYKSNIKGFSKISDRAYKKAMAYMKDLYKLDKEFDKDAERDSARIKKDLLKHLQKTVQESVINEAKDMTLSDYLKVLDKKIEDAQKAVTGKNGSKEEYSNRGDILQNFKLFRNYISSMDKRHKGNKTKLRFISENFDNLVEACWKGYKAVGGKMKNGKQVPNCVPESVVQEAKVETERYFGKKGIIIMIRDGNKMISAIFKDKKNADKFNRNKPADVEKLVQLAKKTKYPKAIDESIDESMFSTIDQIRQDSKDVRDFVKNVFKDRDFKKMSNDKDFIKYLKSIYEGLDESKGVPSNYMQGRTSDYHTALRGKNRDYSGGTNFKKTNHGQPDVEEDDEDQETNHLSNKQTHIKSPLKVAESGKKKSDKNYKDWKSSRLRKEISKKLKEYGQRLDLSFIEDEEAKLDGTYPSKDAIDKDIDETAKRDYKDEYKKFQSSKKSKKYRAELNKYNRDKGTYGNGDGKDASHKGGKIVGFESASKNRGRAEKSRLKKENVAPNHNDKSAPYGSGYKKVNEIGQFPIHNYIQGIIPTGYLDTNTPEKKKQSVKLVGNLKKTLNTFWKQNNIPFRIK